MANEFKSAFTQQMEAFLEHRKQSGVKSLNPHCRFSNRRRFLNCVTREKLIKTRNADEKYRKTGRD